MHSPDFSRLNWRKSSRSTENGGQCVEVAAAAGGGRWLRDSKHPDGPALYFSDDEWDAFLDGAKEGEFD